MGRFRESAEGVLVNIHIANYEPDRNGGGWTFARYFADHFGQSSYEDADIYFITSASMVQRDDVKKAKDDGKKIVLRCDNALRPSRNRNTGMTRLKDFAEWSDLIIYQSKWARDFIEPFFADRFSLIDKPSAVILNGVDTKLYNSDNRTAEADTYLYARSSRDEGKGWIMAWYWFVNNEGRLEIAGKFSSENLEYNFDFYNNESYRFVGEQPSLVDSYKRNKYFLYTFLNEAGSNTLLEARASGCEIVNVYGMLDTGSAPEIMACKDISIERCMREYEQFLSQLT